MSYGHFAYLYDGLMEEAPYDGWVRLVLDAWEKYGPCGEKSLLDLGCGTGELSLRFARNGFSVTGVDLSADMLSVARAKSEEAGLSIPFYEQDMAQLELPDSYGVIGIFCDSLNYLRKEDEVKSTFSHALSHLAPGGLLVFDVHSPQKIERGFVNHSFSLNGDSVSYIWDSFSGEEPLSVEHEISFFVLDESDGRYDRFDEMHYQRTYPPETYRDWLMEVGFKAVSITADFTNSEPKPDSERIFFIAKK
ncbi:SAM-dependent methyltransferase [Neobacillus piezotolerans]|uniref:SAM-dependent methyltransferase n=1 Tax=Neobacillus piezotolerans TaxID=2259171 RepID=A0A3D8GM62_9BACI|nr:class I SAM-dependent methyltransferase [Neobacillus piezotolerans]RDU35451.1 SAM-dependent methyltransferase [Neobacillus piezotolerans]